MKCQEVMRRRASRLPADASVADAAEMMQREGVGLLPVCAPDDSVLGVVTDRDIVLRCCAAGLHAATTPVARVMTTSLISCAASDSVEAACQLMARHQIARMIVLDEAGRLAGILSSADLAQFLEPLRLARLMRELTAREFRVRESLPPPSVPTPRPQSRC